MTTSRVGSIASHVPGRLRLRHAALRRAGVVDDVVVAITSGEGVTSVAGNPRTAGILVLYDVARLPPPEAEALAWAALVEVAALADDDRPDGGGDPDEPDAVRIEPGATSRPSGRTLYATTYRRIRVPVNVAMLATLGGSLLALGVGRRAHAALGVAHLGVLALHLVQYRRRLVT